jgi:FKBP-type peptidyl-prolyl cis-trans isomerase FkpA
MIKKLFLLVLVLGVAGGCNHDVLGAGTPSDPATETFNPSLGVDLAASQRTESGVYYRDIRTGTGEVAAAEDGVTVTFVGRLKDGTIFGSQSTPAQRALALFIRGFRDGVVGMRVGGVRKLVIPSALAYGWEGNPDANPPIPRNATLIFDVELFAVTKPTPATP